MKALLIDIPNKQILRVYADSAIGRDAMPLFVPASPESWTAAVCLSLRVSRLGKSVNEKFGSRYVDSYSAALMLEPRAYAPDRIEQLAGGDIMAHLSCVHNPAELSVMDSALTSGSWAPIADCADITVTDLMPFDQSSSQGALAGTISTSDIVQLAAQAVAIASRISTIKTGDMLLVKGRQVPVSLQRDTYVKASANGSDLLCAKIK